METVHVMQSPAPRAPAGGLPVAVAMATPPDQGQYLIFSLGDESFAIGILAIKEIIEYGSLTKVPMMPEVVRGVINLRGAVVPVIDLLARFGCGQTVAGRRTCIVVVELKQDGEFAELGLIVDAVNEVIEIPLNEIEPAPSFGSKMRTEFVLGMGKVEGRFVIILDIAKVLWLEQFAAARAADGVRTHMEPLAPPPKMS